MKSYVFSMIAMVILFSSLFVDNEWVSLLMFAVAAIVAFISVYRGAKEGLE